MSGRIPTPEQRAAIEAEGQVLVSASAGSGKTFVMVEKIISLVLSGRAETSSVLAVTFTNLAAAEMKERLKKALIARINEESDLSRRRFLKDQLFAVNTADICTLHSFCANVIRRYFYRTDADGSFRVAEEAEAAKLKTRATETLFESKLEEGDADFALLSRAFAGSRGFSRLANILSDTYEKAVSRADYRQFLESIPAMYTEEGFSRLADEMLAPVKARAGRLLEEACRAAEDALPFIEKGLMSKKHAEYCDARAAFARAVSGAPDLFSAAAAAQGAAFPSKPPNTKLKAAGREDALALDGRMAALKEYADDIRQALEGLEDEAALKEGFYASGELAGALSRLLLAFDEEYARLKRRAGVLDFSDLEHKCLALLRIPEVGKEVRGRYSHVFVDEYQDVNPAQEEILSLVSGKNVFMVGDAKQSIYGFRGCSAAFFTDKYEKFKADGRALELNGNFRTADAVLDAVNRIFSAAMTRETCSIDYAATSVMRGGGLYPEGAGRVRYDLLPEKEKKEKEAPEIYSVAAHLEGGEEEESREGAKIAAIIAEELSAPRFDAAEGKFVQMEFKDIAVLTRGKTAKAERIISELVKRGVPVASSAEYNICDYAEVKTMIDILKYIDNAAQDIPLAAALRSAVGGVCDEELAKIRASCSQYISKSPENGGSREDLPFYVACAEYARTGTDALAEKLKKFFSLAEKYRLLASVKSAAEIMAGLLSETDLQISLLSMPCGAERLSRVMRLIAEAGTLTVPEFLDKLKAGGYKVGYSESGGENAVKVMTMHASKGLEFPVVIVAGMNDRFSVEDMKGDFLFDEEWGFAPCAYDFDAFRLKDTILRRAVRARLTKKRAEDEMRLLYVAATRAQFSLHFVFSERKPFDIYRVPEAGCFADFIDFDRCDYFAEGEDAPLPAYSPRTLVLGEPDEEAKREVLRRYRAPYPHAESLSLPVKTSATEILKSFGKIAEPYYPAAKLMQEEPLAAADTATGTAYHAFLELADFFAKDKGAETARVLSALFESAPELAALIDAEKAADILSMPVFEELRGFTLSREREFLMSAPACELYGTACKDEILVQGAIDLMAVKGEECILVDYKYSSHDAERLKKDYAPQLKVYAAAAKRAAGVKNVRAYIVGILRGEWVRVL